MRKKILSLALILALTLSLSVSALAVSVTETPTKYYASGGETGTDVRFSEGLAVVQGGESEEYRFGYIDTTGKVAIACQYIYAKPFSEGLAAVQDKESGDLGYIDQTGKLVIPFQYDHAGPFSEGMALVGKSEVVDLGDGTSQTVSHYGYIDTAGKLVIPFQYDDASGFSDGLARVWKDGKAGYIDKTGKAVIPCQYEKAGDFSEGVARVWDESGKAGYIDTTGKTVIPFEYNFVGDFSEGMAFARYEEDEKWGYIDTTGEMVVPGQYSDESDFSEGMAYVWDESGKIGYIDKTGKMVIPCQYTAANDFSQGLAAVQDASSGKWGYIDQTGKVVIPFQYTDVYGESGNFSDGVAVVVDENYKAVILNLNDGQPSGFTDVAAGAYYADAVAWAVEKGITTGTGSNTFSPEITCTTAQILTFLWRANGSPAPAGSDASVPAGQYYSDAANWALEKGLTDSFTADTPCTRLATVTYLWKLAGSPAVTDENPFTDVTGDAQAVVWAMNEGITTGSSATTFSPDVICTRGQIVTFLHRDLAE